MALIGFARGGDHNRSIEKCLHSRPLPSMMPLLALSVALLNQGINFVVGDGCRR